MRALGIIALGRRITRTSAFRRRRRDDSAERLDERLDTISRGLLGLSVTCARCHNHKFDPIQQKDYYRLLSVFASTQRALRPLFEVDPKTETRFMWATSGCSISTTRRTCSKSDPGSKPDQAAPAGEEIPRRARRPAGRNRRDVEDHPEIAAYIKTVPYPGEKAPAVAGAKP